jgi:hypothetical protein
VSIVRKPSPIVRIAVAPLASKANREVDCRACGIASRPSAGSLGRPPPELCQRTHGNRRCLCNLGRPANHSQLRTKESQSLYPLGVASTMGARPSTPWDGWAGSFVTSFGLREQLHLSDRPSTTCDFPVSQICADLAILLLQVPLRRQSGRRPGGGSWPEHQGAAQDFLRLGIPTPHLFLFANRRRPSPGSYVHAASPPPTARPAPCSAVADTRDPRSGQDSAVSTAS